MTGLVVLEKMGMLVLLMAVGFAAAKANWVGDGFNQATSRLVANVFLPASILSSVIGVAPLFSGKELAVAFVSKLGLGTPETAIPPFNTKLITDDELDKNMLVAAVNGATLKKLGLYEGNRIVLTSKAGKVMAKIRVFEGVTNDTVALTMGFGHTAFGEFNDGKGMDVMALVTPSSEPGSGLSVWNDTRVNVAQA